MAVIIILAVIALISVPIVLNMIEKTRMSAFADTAYGLMESAKLAYVENLLDGKSEVKTYVYPFDDLKFSGSKPNGGMIRIDEQKNIEIAIYNNKWCAFKTKENQKIELIAYDETTCKLEDIEEINIRTFKEEMENNSTEVMSNDPDHNLRYVGSDPNNYVSFNNELWRIIGLFDEQAKIMRVEYTSVEWDKKEVDGGHGSYGQSDWRTSTLQVELNTTFLNNIEETNKKYIDQSHIWNLGGWNTSNITRDVMYAKERGTEVNSGREANWTGAIGLMYPSDYAYATSSGESYCDTVVLHSWNSSSYSDCRNKDWIYSPERWLWVLTPYSGSEHYSNSRMFHISSDGYVDDWGVASDLNDVKAVLYLKSEVKIKSGNGTKESPFQLTI